VCKYENVGRKLLKTVQTMTTFRNPLADSLGARRGPPLGFGPRTLAWYEAVFTEHGFGYV